MEIAFDLSKVSNAEELCWYYYEGSDPPKDGRDWTYFQDNLWMSLSPITTAIVGYSELVGLKVITKSNLLEWYYRIECLYDAGEYYLMMDTPEGEVPMRIKMNDLIEHLGLRVQGMKLLTNKEFDLSTRRIRMKRIMDDRG